MGLAFGLMVTASSAVAQANTSFDATLEDLSMDLDALPPQPSQTIVSEEPVMEGIIDGVTEEVTQEVTDAEPAIPENSENIPTQPADPLTPAPLTSSTPPELSVEPIIGQLEVTPEAPIPHSGQYYDSDSFAPDPNLGMSAPREVDPKYEPASRFVVVSKSAGPDSMPAQLVSAQRALSLGRYTSALEMYEQLYKKSPRNTQVLMGLAVAQQNSGFSESAIATYEELLKIDPKNTNATSNMLGLVMQKYPSVAYQKLQALWDKNSQNPSIAAQLGLTNAAVGDTQEAIRYLGIAASIEPNNPSHYYNMAVVADRAGAYKDAIDYYQKALEVDAAYAGGRTLPRDNIYDRLADLRRL